MPNKSLNRLPAESLLKRMELGQIGLRIPSRIVGTSFLGNLYEANTYDQKSELVLAVLECFPNRIDFDSARKYGHDLATGLTQAQMRDQIRHERRIEMAYEGLCYYDLKRWKIAGEVLNNVTDGVIQYNFEEKFYEWPLPQSEIDKSNGVLIQNENY